MRILVVEDEPRLAQLLKRALEHDAHDVEITLDGLDGLRQAESGSFEVIVLDILLPRLDGLEVCRRLRAGGIHTPVLMLTARDAVYQRVEGLDAGADDYLTKPFAIAELLARIRALQRRRGPAADEVLQIADLALNPGRHQVHRQETPIELTRKEFDLLEYLMRHPNQVLSRAQIMDQVWGYEFSTLTNVVDIYVHYLRNKIEKGFGKKLIRTVRGVGYSITDGA
jgi:DNA-binding response OmpR family regulator